MKKILFWDENHKPQDFVNTNVRELDRNRIIDIMKRAVSTRRYKGFARCRICGDRLGASDMKWGKYVWPQKAEHYVEKHDVWVPEFNDIIEAADVAYMQKQSMRALNVPKKYLKKIDNPLSEPEDYWIEDDS
jgi:hypothetical protein